MSTLDVVLKFDPSGKMVRSFGAGMFVFPHGIHVDRDGNVWVTDGQDNLPRRGRGAAADAPLPPPPATIVGHQVIKFSPEGKVLLTLGKAGGNRPGEPADPSSFYQPNDVTTNAAGEIFVAEGHSSGAGSNARISKFDKTGKFIKEWGKRGTGPGEFDQPHALAWDSKGRLFIADRGNNRIQIYDQDGKLLDTGWEQYSRISGLWIDPERHALRRRFGVRLGRPSPERLEERHTDRQYPGRQGRQDSVLHPRSVDGHERHPGRRGGRRGRRREHLWSRSRPEGTEEVREEVNRAPLTSGL